MPWFKVDDKFHDHPKVRRLGKDKLAAIGLWALCGSWAGDTTSDGFVPLEIVQRHDPRERVAARLVAVGLWHKVTKGGEPGYEFHQWDERQPTRASIEAEREEWRGRKARQRKKSTRDSRGTHAGQPVDNSVDVPTGNENPGQKSDQETVTTAVIHRGYREVAEAPGHHGGDPQGGPTSEDDQLSRRDSRGSHADVRYPSRPVPSRTSGHPGEGTSPLARADETPPAPRCPKHEQTPADGPCGKCADARRAREAWEDADAARREHIARDIERAVADPRQRCDHGTDGGRFLHPVTGKSATCALCRAESTRDTA